MTAGWAPLGAPWPTGRARDGRGDGPSLRRLPAPRLDGRPVLRHGAGGAPGRAGTAGRGIGEEA